MRVQAEKPQESPDAILVLGDGRHVGLELTSCLPPKGSPARHSPHINPDMSRLRKVLDRKLQYDYRIEGVDEVWLLVELSLTLSKDRIVQAVEGVLVPNRFQKVFIQWPSLERREKIGINVLELPEYRFWIPDLPRPQRNKK